MTYKVTRKYVPIVGTSEFAPGEHYRLVSTVPDRHVGRDAYRQFSFYRTPKGSEVAGDLGYSGGNYWEVAKDSPTFRDLKQAVEEWEASQSHR